MLENPAPIGRMTSGAMRSSEPSLAPHRFCLMQEAQWRVVAYETVEAGYHFHGLSSKGLKRGRCCQYGNSWTVVYRIPEIVSHASRIDHASCIWSHEKVERHHVVLGPWGNEVRGQFSSFVSKV